MKGQSKITWFEVCKHLEAFIEYFICLAEQHKLDHLGER